jgi:hypothetical protein
MSLRALSWLAGHADAAPSVTMSDIMCHSLLDWLSSRRHAASMGLHSAHDPAAINLSLVKPKSGSMREMKRPNIVSYNFHAGLSYHRLFAGVITRISLCV